MGSIKFCLVIKTALFKPLALTDIFHDLECSQGSYAMFNQIVHDVVSGGNGFFQFDCAASNQILRIVQPYVGPVGESGNSYQFGEVLRPGIFQHAADERRPVFRKPEGSYGNPLVPDHGSKLLRRKAQCFSGAEERQCLLVIKWNLKRIDARNILEHADNLRIIVAQDIQLEHTARDGMVIEMGGNGSGDAVSFFILQVLLVGRILQRREVMDVHIPRADHDACRMLARRPLDACHAGRELFNEDIVEGESSVFRILLDETVGCLVLDACNGPCAENIVTAEEFFRVLMGNALIIP
jgi:hypothetical protein